MKKLFIALLFMGFASFTNKDDAKKLQNGHYLVVLDQKYKDQELNDFDFTLKDEKFTMKIGGKYEDLEIKWKDENTFAVIGFTEPKDPPDFLKNSEKFYFKIAPIDSTEFYFTMGLEFDEYPVFAGKFIKTD